MILQHVAHGSGAVVIGTTVFHTEGFVDADLHVLDVPAAPHRLEQRIGKTQRHQVLHGLLAQVMVDTKHLCFAEHPADGRVDRLSRSQRMADGFFQHDAAPRVGQPGRGQVLSDRRKQRRGGSQVEDAQTSRRVAE